MTIERAFQHLDLAGPVASPRALKRAYRKAVLRWHPDRFTDPVQKMDAEAATYGIMAAYEFLKGLPENDGRLYVRPVSRWGRRGAEAPKATSAGTAMTPVRQQWLPSENPVASTWGHQETDRRCGPVRAVFYSGLVAAGVMALVLVFSANWHQSAAPNGSAATQEATKARAQVASVPPVPPPRKIAPSLLEDNREITRKAKEASAKRRGFGESNVEWQKRRGAAGGPKGNREDRELQKWVGDYENRTGATLRGK